MGFFTRTAMDMLMKTTHPEINRRQCWNLHPHRKPCTECKDICPYGEQIFTRPNLVKDWDPCTECGLCVSACRSGCIIPSPEQVQRDTSAADTDNDTIWIGCEKSTRKNSMVRTCISALTWETLAYLALNKKIVLDLTPCGECENDLCAAQLRKELTRLVDFFGQPMFEARFTLAYEPDEALYHVKELSRREMFEQVSHGSKSGTKKLLQMLPGLHSEDDGGVDFRLLLHQRTKQLKAAMDTPLKYGYYLPNFTDKCFGCGKCEKACPQHLPIRQLLEQSGGLQWIRGQWVQVDARRLSGLLEREMYASLPGQLELLFRNAAKHYLAPRLKTLAGYPPLTIRRPDSLLSLKTGRQWQPLDWQFDTP